MHKKLSGMPVLKKNMIICMLQGLKNLRFDFGPSPATCCLSHNAQETK
jgi:hypothetical protein